MSKCYLCGVEMSLAFCMRYHSGATLSFCANCAEDSNFETRLNKILSQPNPYHSFQYEHGAPAPIQDWCNGSTVPKCNVTVNTTITPDTNDSVNHPAHYTKGIEVMEFVESWDLDRYCHNVVKYICRAPYKGKMIEDLKKAKWYLERKIEWEEKKLLDKK